MITVSTLNPPKGKDCDECFDRAKYRVDRQNVCQGCAEDFVEDELLRLLEGGKRATAKKIAAGLPPGLKATGAEALEDFELERV